MPERAAERGRPTTCLVDQAEPDFVADPERVQDACPPSENEEHRASRGEAHILAVIERRDVEPQCDGWQVGSCPSEPVPFSCP